MQHVFDFQAPLLLRCIDRADAFGFTLPGQHPEEPKRFPMSSVYKEFKMAQPIYKFFMAKFTDAWYQLSEQEQKNFVAKYDRALAKAGGIGWGQILTYDICAISFCKILNARSRPAFS